MYSKTQLAFKYIKYYLTASNGKGHGIHSPFVFEFVNEVLNDDRNFYSYQQIEELRQQLLHNKKQIQIEDFGAGSRVVKDNTRLVSAIAASSLKPKKFAQLLFRMAAYYKPTTILELGTSLGITTSYLASANPNTKVVTMEGSPAVAAVAKANFKQLALQNIQVVEGNFDNTLSSTIHQLAAPIDLAFLDGNHRYQPTIEYFEKVLAKADNDSIIILDDIHWSKEMEDAWHWVQQHHAVTLTIDLFFIGIVIIKKEIKVKQHFAVRF